MPQPGDLLGQQLGDYRILSEIGEGGMGRVYLAEHVQYGVKYALKVLPEELSQSASFVRRFRREAGVMASLKHSHIVEVHNMSQSGDTYFLVMDYIEGPQGKPWNLEDEIALRKARGKGFSEQEVKRLVTQIAEAVAYAHEQGVIHRDLKPSNILLDQGNQVRVVDFGLSRVVGEDYVVSKLFGESGPKGNIETQMMRTASGAILGTFDFMSPEQKEGKPADARSDVYALGVVIYYLLTGSKPSGLGKVPSSFVRGIDRRWDQLVSKCLEPAPEQRFQRVGDLAKALHRMGSPKARRPAAMAAILLLVGGGIVWALLPSGPEGSGFSLFGFGPTATPTPTATMTATPRPTATPTATLLAPDEAPTPDPKAALPRVEVKGHSPPGAVTYLDRSRVTVDFIGVPAAGGGIQRYLWRLDGGEWKETTRQYVQMNDLPVGTHRFEVKAVDYDGAESPPTVHELVVLDNAPPAVEWTAPKASILQLAEGKALEVSARAEDAEGDEIVEWWWAVGSTDRPPERTEGGSEGRYQWPSLAGGLQTLYVAAMDSAGKRSEWVMKKVVITYFHPTPSPTAANTATPTATRTATPTATPTATFVAGQTTAITIPDSTVSIEMVMVPGGWFLMGSPESEPGREEDEGPAFRVTVRPFWLGKYEVTQAQWDAVMGSNPSRFRGEEFPVENVSWNQCKYFVDKLNRLLGGAGLRLPSEAEWEYACRARSTTPFSTGETTSTELANYDGNYTYEEGAKGAYRRTTTAVGSFPSNPWGFHDMHGNVWEWCQDWYRDSYRGMPADGSAWDRSQGTSRVLRGGSWIDVPKRCRSACRSWDFPDVRLSSIGFRLASNPGGVRVDGERN